MPDDMKCHVCGVSRAQRRLAVKAYKAVSQAGRACRPFRLEATVCIECGCPWEVHGLFWVKEVPCPTL